MSEILILVHVNRFLMNKIKIQLLSIKISCLDQRVGWFYSISTFVGNLMPNPFLYK